MTTVVLAIDTATDTVVTGVARLDAAPTADDRPDVDLAVRVVADRAVADHRRHAEVLTTLMSEAMTEAGLARTDLSAVVVGVGPGPFTGLRVGMATGAAFGDALGIPVFGVGTLDAIAATARAGAPDARTVLVVTDARRREVYWARYRDGLRVAGPAVAAPTAVAEEVAGETDDEPIDLAAGSAEHLRAAGWTGPDPAVAVPSVAGLVTVALPAILSGAAPEPPVPLYLRRPDALTLADRAAKAARGAVPRGPRRPA